MIEAVIAGEENPELLAELAPVSTNSPPPLFVLKGGLYPGHHGAYATKILEAGIVGIKGFGGIGRILMRMKVIAAAPNIFCGGLGAVSCCLFCPCCE
jgi:hypothetical protein